MKAEAATQVLEMQFVGVLIGAAFPDMIRDSEEALPQFRRNRLRVFSSASGRHAVHPPSYILALPVFVWAICWWIYRKRLRKRYLREIVTLIGEFESFPSLTAIYRAFAEL